MAGSAFSPIFMAPLHRADRPMKPMAAFAPALISGINGSGMTRSFLVRLYSCLFHCVRGSHPLRHLHLVLAGILLLLRNRLRNQLLRCRALRLGMSLRLRTGLFRREPVTVVLGGLRPRIAGSIHCGCGIGLVSLRADRLGRRQLWALGRSRCGLGCLGLCLACRRLETDLLTEMLDARTDDRQLAQPLIG